MIGRFFSALAARDRVKDAELTENFPILNIR
jgi:hypothetical protein